MRGINRPVIGIQTLDEFCSQHPWAVVFLDTLEETAHVGHSVAAANISRKRAYELKNAVPSFHKAWEEAYQRSVGTLEDEATRRAVEGVDKPVYYQGQKIGTIREYSDSLLQFLLACRKPEVYSKARDLNHSGEIALVVTYAEKLTPPVEDIEDAEL